MQISPLILLLVVSFSGASEQTSLISSTDSSNNVDASPLDRLPDARAPIILRGDVTAADYWQELLSLRFLSVAIEPSVAVPVASQRLLIQLLDWFIVLLVAFDILAWCNQYFFYPGLVHFMERTVARYRASLPPAFAEIRLSREPRALVEPMLATHSSVTSHLPEFEGYVPYYTPLWWNVLNMLCKQLIPIMPMSLVLVSTLICMMALVLGVMGQAALSPREFSFVLGHVLRLHFCYAIIILFEAILR